MHTPNDEQFERYLKQFRPVAPEVLPSAGTSLGSHRSLRLGAWVAALAALLMFGTLILVMRRIRVVVAPQAPRDVASMEQRAASEPLTLRSANAWLARAPSFHAAVDALAFRSSDNSVRQGQQSAVALLSKEKIKL